MPGTGLLPSPVQAAGSSGVTPVGRRCLQPCGHLGRRRDWGQSPLPTRCSSASPALVSARDGAASRRGLCVALTFVKRRVQEGVVEEQAAALSPALGLAPHHQLAVAGRLQTFRHREREGTGRVRRCWHRGELHTSSALLSRGYIPPESSSSSSRCCAELGAWQSAGFMHAPRWHCVCKPNSEPDAAQPLPAPSCPSLSPPGCCRAPRCRHCLSPTELSITGTLFCPWNGRRVPGAPRHGVCVGRQFPGAFSVFQTKGRACPPLPPALRRGWGRRRCCTGTPEVGSVPGSATSSPLHPASRSICLVPQSPSPPRCCPSPPPRSCKDRNSGEGRKTLVREEVL